MFMNDLRDFGHSPCRSGNKPSRRAALVSLAEARQEALANRKLARAGGDPLADRRRRQGIPTFAEAAARLIEQKRTGWRNAREARHWRNSLARYALPRIGTRPRSPAPTCWRS